MQQPDSMALLNRSQANRVLLRRLVLTVAVMLALASTGWAIWRWQPDPWAQRHLDHAQTLAGTNHYDEARAELRDLLRRLPYHREARWRMVQIELRTGRLEHAYLEVKSFTELYPESADGWFVMASLMSSGGLLEEAEAAADNALAADPGQRESRALRAGIRLRRARYYGAWLDARAVLAQTPDNVAAGVVLSQASAVVEGNATAIAITRELLARRDEPALRIELARRLIEGGRIAEAQALLSSAAAAGPTQRDADVLRARLALRAGNVATARTLLEGAIAARPADEEPIALRALADAVHGDLDAAKMRLDRVLMFQPKLPMLHGVRDGLERDPEGARAFLDRLVRAGLAPPATVPPQATRLHQTERRQRGELTEAHAMIWPGSLAVLRRESDHAIQQKDWSAAQAVAARAQQAFSGTLIGPWILGVIELAQDHLDAAERHFEGALVLAPRSGLVTKALAQVWAKRDNAARAGERLAALLERDPGFAFARRHAANTFLNARLPDRAEAVLHSATAAAGAGAGAYQDLALFYLELDRAGDALRICAEGLSRFPEDLELRSLEARIRVRAGEPDRAIALLEAVLKAAPDRAADAAELARLFAAQGQAGRARALELVTHLEQDAPTDVNVADAIGWTHQLTGDPRRAQPWLEAAARTAPARSDIRFHIASVYARLGERGRARAELQQALGSGVPFTEQLDAQRLMRSLDTPR